MIRTTQLKHKSITFTRRIGIGQDMHNTGSRVMRLLLLLLFQDRNGEDAMSYSIYVWLSGTIELVVNIMNNTVSQINNIKFV